MNKLDELMRKVGVTYLSTNRSMTTDELISFLGCRVCNSEDESFEIGADVGEIVDENGNPTGIFYEEIEYLDLDESIEEDVDDSWDEEEEDCWEEEASEIGADGCVLQTGGTEPVQETAPEPEPDFEPEM